MGSCFPGSLSLLCSSVVCKYSLKYLVFENFINCIEKKFLLCPTGIERKKPVSQWMSSSQIRKKI